MYHNEKNPVQFDVWSDIPAYAKLCFKEKLQNSE